MCGHTFLYSPPVRAIKRILEAGELGELHYISSSRVNLGPYRSDVSVVFDLGPHDFSILRYWLDSLPHTVSAMGRDVISTGVADFAFVNAIFEDGLVANMELSWLAPSKLRRTVLVGSEKMAVYEDNSPEPVRIYDSGIEYRDPETYGEYHLAYRTGDIVSPRVDTSEPIALELEDFVGAIRGEVDELPDSRDRGRRDPHGGGDRGLDGGRRARGARRGARRRARERSVELADGGSSPVAVQGGTDMSAGSARLGADGRFGSLDRDGVTRRLLALSDLVSIALAGAVTIIVAGGREHDAFGARRHLAGLARRLQALRSLRARHEADQPLEHRRPPVALPRRPRRDAPLLGADQGAAGGGAALRRGRSRSLRALSSWLPGCGPPCAPCCRASSGPSGC